MIKNIEVSDGKENKIGKAIEIAETGGTVLDYLDNPVETFGGGVSEVALDEGENVSLIGSKGRGEGAKSGDAGAESGRDPGLEEFAGGIEVFEIPESFELVFEYPSAMNAAVGGTELLDSAGLIVGAVAGVQGEEPAHAFEGAALIAGFEFAPFIDADGIDGLVEGLDDVETVEDESGIRAVVFDGLDIGAAHIATGPTDAAALVFGEVLGEERVDGLAAFTGANPEDPGAVQIINDGGELAALGIGDFIDSDSDQTTDFVTGAGAGDDAVKQVGEGGLGHVEQEGGGLLSHHLAESADAEFEA